MEGGFEKKILRAQFRGENACNKKCREKTPVPLFMGKIQKNATDYFILQMEFELYLFGDPAKTKLFIVGL